MLKPLK